MYDVLRADRCISANALEGRVPFADLDFVDYTMRIDPKKKMNTYNKGKYLLRHAFEGLNYLPQDILFREKAAFSDAVGHSMVDYLKEYADSLYTDEDVKNAEDKYPYCTPFTKESLLYRDIFESYYPAKPNGSRISGCLIRLGKTVMSMTQVLEYLKTMVTLENNVIMRMR